MRKVKTTDAIGMVLCHDLTKIVPGEFKGVAFKKGHVIVEEDVEELLKMGKEHIYVWECDEDKLHENEAATRIANAAAGLNIGLTEPKEGKVNFKANYKGLLKINIKVLEEINHIEEVALATRHNNSVVEKDTVLAGCRVIPLLINKDKIEKVEELCALHGPIVELIQLKALKAGVITTGNEVFYGRIEDRFGPVVIKKLEALDCRVIQHSYLPDDSEQITKQIKDYVDQGMEMVVVTGGMSVDPDDATPGGVKGTGAEIVTYGTPLFPGAMFLLAYLDDIPIMGLPGCVMYSNATVFDVLLPRVLAGERITRKDITRMGHGGLCLECPECHFPHCSFGKG